MRRAAALLVLVLASTLRAQEERSPILDDRDRAAAVLRFLASHCVDCHGSHLEKPKGDIGFMLDLPRLIEERVAIPGKPEASDLYLQLAKGKMPPPESDLPRPTPEEIELVRSWIAGAPTQASTPPAPRPARAIVLVGRMHPLTVHFPIALLIVGALAELIDAQRRRTTLATARTYCIILGAIGATIAAALGWLMAWADSKSGPSLELHRWLGTGAAVLALAAAAITLKPGVKPALLRVALVLSAVAVGVAAHFGGLLVFGADYFW